MIEYILAASIFVTDAHGNTGEPFPGYFPPPKYDVPYKGTMIVEWMDSREIMKHCRTWGVACILPDVPWNCVIAINEDYRPHKWTILRHENGHCNGWPKHHPQGIER